MTQKEVDRVAPEELMARHSESEHYFDVPGGEDRCAVCFELVPCSPFRAAQYIEILEGAIVEALNFIDVEDEPENASAMLRRTALSNSTKEEEDEEAGS